MAEAFEEGATITGKPTLWIPLSYTGIRQRAAKYAASHGLFRVDRQGKPPLLLSNDDKKPKFVGLTMVHLRKRFHLREAAGKIVERIPAIYAEMLAKVRKD